MKTLRFLLTALFLSASLSISFGAAFHTGQTSASYTGQGQTGVTFFDNAGLVVQNPAAMTKLNHGMHFYGGFTRYSTTFSYSDLDGGNSTIPPILPQSLLKAMRFITGVTGRLVVVCTFLSTLD